MLSSRYLRIASWPESRNDPPLQKRRKPLITLACMLVAVIAVLAWHNREPGYAGHSLTYWLELNQRQNHYIRLARDPLDPKATAAVSAIGADALPILLTHMKAHIMPSRFRGFGFRALRLLPFEPIRRWASREQGVSMDRIEMRALASAAAFSVLRDKGKPTIPELARMAMEGSDATSHLAVMALEQIGPEALPALSGRP